MARRLAAISALVLAAALVGSPGARAQSFFSFYEMSARDVLDRLDDQGYSARLPMIRRGDVYIVDARTSEGRMVRLIVEARSGRILQRFATTPRWRDDDSRSSRWRDPYARAVRSPDEEDAQPERRRQAALGDLAAPDDDGLYGGKLLPPANIQDGSKRREPRKRLDAPLAKEAPASAPKPEPTLAAVAPAEVKPVEVAKPAPPKARDPAPVKAPASSPQAKVEDKPAPKPLEPKLLESKSPEPKPAPVAQARAEDKPVAKVAPMKPEAPRRKLNDLPVGTLD